MGALTARNVALAVGVTAPALYRHFPGGKADIATRLDLLDAIPGAAPGPGGGPALDKLHRCYRRHIETIQRYRAPAQPRAGRFPLGRRARTARPDACLASCSAGNGREDHRHGASGELRADIGPDQIFVQFLGQFLTIAILYSRHGHMVDLEGQAEGPAGRCSCGPWPPETIFFTRKVNECSHLPACM